MYFSYYTQQQRGRGGFFRGRGGSRGHSSRGGFRGGNEYGAEHTDHVIIPATKTGLIIGKKHAIKIIYTHLVKPQTPKINILLFFIYRKKWKDYKEN